MNYFELAAVLLAVFVFNLRAQPRYPATVVDIETDGGRWVKQTDGRLIEYFRCGRRGGTPLYFQHGYGFTGKLIFALPGLCESATKLGLEVFSPSQPGFGLSSTYPLNTVRTLKEWPADVDLILQQEKINQFYVAGYSAGCVHALTIAHAYKDRVLGLGISTPTTPLEVERQTNGAMALPTKFVRKTFVYPYVGDLLGFLMSLMDGKGRMAAAPDVLAALNKMEAKGKAGEARWGKIMRDLVEDQNRGMVKGFRGWQDNMAILNEDVPFDPFALAKALRHRGRKMVIASSVDDTTNPPIMQEWWAKNLPGSELMHVSAGWGHLHIVGDGVTHELLRRMRGKAPNKV